MSLRTRKRKEIDQRSELVEFVEEGRSLRDWVVQAVDIRGIDLDAISVENTLFIGCHFDNDAVRERLTARGARFLPELEDLPYRPYRRSLYTVEELLEGYQAGSYIKTADSEIYTHFDRERHHEAGVAIREALAQRLHDHSIDDALEETVAERRGRGVVGIMGGHSTGRDDPHYAEVVRLCWLLTRAGYFIASGGGPGIMEAANLGAYLSPYEDEYVLEAALEVLVDAPKYDGNQTAGTPEYAEAIGIYIEKARQVCDLFFGPDSQEMAERYQRQSDTPGKSLAIPTWFYGHEPTNLFGNHIAKYFSNSLREDGLLAIADAGVVYAPGSAGTLQEVFMDLAQNHYATFGARSPMVFLGEKAFGELYGFIRGFIERRDMQQEYGEIVTLVRSADEALDFIEANPLRPVTRVPPVYDLIE